MDINTEKADNRRIKYIALLTSVVAITMSIFHIYTSAFGLLDFITQRGVHLAFAVTLMVLTKPLYNPVNVNSKTALHKTKKILFNTIDLLILFGIWFAVFASKYDYMMKLQRAGAYSFISVIAGFFLLVIVLEFGRRYVGLILPSLAILSIVYALIGPYLPLAVRHKGYSLEKIFAFISTNADGMFGMTLSVSATIIFMFVLFGAFLEVSKASNFINKIAISATRKLKSGPALSSVLASALMGTINGSAVANVVATGTFTIPLMKSRGYKAEFAGAVEAVASTGGQFLPPVMGSAAFLMVAFTEISYTNIAIAAAIPAVLYFFGAAVSVIINAEKTGLVALKADDSPKERGLLIDALLYALPIIILITTLIVFKITPTMSALYSTLSIPLVMIFDKKKRFGLVGIPESLKLAAYNAIPVIAGCATAGIIVSMVALTGIGVVFGDIMISLSNGNLFLALLFTALGCVVLGMGLPTSASYVMAATIMAPTLVRLGVSLMAAHMFVLYYACLAAITPPVALASYAGAAIAKGNASKTGIEACKVGFVGFVIPFMFVYNTVLLAQGSFFEIAYTILTSAIGIISMSIGFQGWMYKKVGMIGRFIALIGGLAMVVPEAKTDIVGFILFGIILFDQIRYKKNLKSNDLTSVK